MNQSGYEISKKEAYWKEVIKRYEDGNLGPVAFCRETGIPPSTFYQWQKRLRDKGSIGEGAPFIPLKIVADRQEPNHHQKISSGESAEIIFRDGTSLRLKDVNYQELIRTLRP